MMWVYKKLSNKHFAHVRQPNSIGGIGDASSLNSVDYKEMACPQVKTEEVNHGQEDIYNIL